MRKQPVPQTDKDKILSIAEKHGFLHRPKFYLDEVYEQYGTTVTNSSVTKALGTWVNRLRLNKKKVRTKARELLDSCFWDYGAASSNLWSASKESSQ